MRIAAVVLLGVALLPAVRAGDTLTVWHAHPQQGAFQFDAIGGAGNFLFQIARRDGKAGAEVHKNWTYVFAAQAGEATIVHGGEVENLRERDKAVDDGEFRGTGLIGAQSQKVLPGDVVMIPAGLPYQIVIEPGKVFNFFVVKMQKK